MKTIHLDLELLSNCLDKLDNEYVVFNGDMDLAPESDLSSHIHHLLPIKDTVEIVHSDRFCRVARLMKQNRFTTARQCRNCLEAVLLVSTLRKTEMVKDDPA